MNITFDAAPENVRQLAIKMAMDHLRDPIRRSSEIPRLTPGQSVFIASSSKGNRMQTAWLFALVINETDVAATIEVPVDAETIGGRIQEPRLGKFIAEALVAAEDVAGADAIARVLEIPELFVRAIWLHTDGEERFIPLSTAPPPLRKLQPMTSTDFNRAVQSILERRMRAVSLSETLHADAAAAER